MAITLRSPISDIKFVGEKSALKLRRLGISRVIDLLFYFPVRYEDRTSMITIEEASSLVGDVVNIQGNVLSIKQFYHKYRHMHITTITIEDDTGALACVWFRQPYIAKQFSQGDSICVTGKIRLAKQGIQMQPTGYEKILSRDSVHSGRIVPVYSETKGMTSKYIRRLVYSSLALTKDVPESLPKHICSSNDLASISWALQHIHFPETQAQAMRARHRFAFEELLLIQLHSQIMQAQWNALTAHRFAGFSSTISKFQKNLPFTLTSAQKRSWKEIAADIRKTTPMNRLVEGDVGSGKTVLASMALLAAKRVGFQSVLIAPTDILAKQHFETLCNDLGKNARIGLFTGKTRYENRNQFGLFAKTEEYWISPSKKEMLARIASGELDIIIGTHALLQPTVKYASLGLVIIDEQHRFGVEQRDALLHRGNNGRTPHLLTMSATPIPRTLYLALFGELDISILDEMPPGRKKILTKVVDTKNREKAYNFIRERLQKGRQMFVITPLVEESEMLRVKAATVESERLQKDVFRDFTVGLLHGRMKAKEKESIMQRFVSGEITILVSTSVIEVGVNIPNATIMLIEGAERFGLAQLHQFRGRVGRGTHQSFCFLFQENESAQSKERLHALCQSNNGFELAEFDLSFRGAGNVFGTEQSGIITQLKVANISDTATVLQCQTVAQEVLSNDPQLQKNTLLKKRLQAFRERIHFE